MGQTQAKGKDGRDEKGSKSRTLRQKGGGELSRSKENITNDSNNLQGNYLEPLINCFNSTKV